jgi:DNA polymerase-4
VIVAHLDLDAFFAAVAENPALRAVPLVVGGDPRGRGVVATANYVARRFGVVSALSCAEALRRCPQAVFVRPRGALYREYSREVWSIVREIVPTVEQAGIDEGYLDLGELAPEFDDARALAEAVRAVVKARTRLSVFSRLATSRRCRLVRPASPADGRGRARASFLAPFPIRVLPGRAAGGGRLSRRGRDDRGAGRARRRRPGAAASGEGRPDDPRSGERGRSPTARGLDRAHLGLDRGDLRARRR